MKTNEVPVIKIRVTPSINEIAFYIRNMIPQSMVLNKEFNSKFS